MIKTIDMEEFMTEGLQKMLNSKCSIVKTIELTCMSTPEQYDCFDQYGNQVAYLRLRGNFTVECPGCDLMRSWMVYSVAGDGEEIDGYGNFASDTERIEQLSAAIDAIDDFYNNEVHLISRDEENDDYEYAIKSEETKIQKALFRLYEYEQSNFLPYQVMDIRRKGPVLGYYDCCMRIIKDHRLKRNRMFPEANGRDGLSDEHIEDEIKFIKSSEFTQFSMIETINYLFGKKWDDFEKIFREESKKGWNSL